MVGPTASRSFVAQLPAPETKRAARKGGTWRLFYWREVWCQSTRALPEDQTSAGLPLRQAGYPAFSNPVQRIGTLLGQEKRCLQASRNDRIYLLSNRNMWTRDARLLRASHGIL
jgi:hypothetical protein